MRSVRTTRGILATSFLAISLTLTAGTVASAATANTYVTGWGIGKDSSWRAANSNVSQTWKFAAKCTSTRWHASTTISTVQMQFQRANGLGVVSLGNKALACGSSASAGNWGKVSKGLKHRYQYNGAKIPGYQTLQDIGLSSTKVVITY